MHLGRQELDSSSIKILPLSQPCFLRCILTTCDTQCWVPRVFGDEELPAFTTHPLPQLLSKEVGIKVAKIVQSQTGRSVGRREWGAPKSLPTLWLVMFATAKKLLDCYDLPGTQC